MTNELKKVLVTKTYHSANCDTDHSPFGPPELRYKNSDRCDWNTCRSISILSIVGKLFARNVLHRLQIFAYRIYPESQCGFHSKRSTVDMIFSLRQLQEKCREQNQPFYLALIDLAKALDFVRRDGLFKMLPLIGCPPRVLKTVRSFHDGMMSTVQFHGDLSAEFGVESDVKHCCEIAPTLFGIFFALQLKRAFKSCTDGVYLFSRSDPVTCCTFQGSGTRIRSGQLQLETCYLQMMQP